MSTGETDTSTVSSAVAAGVVLAATILMVEISFAALVFTGPLQRHIGAGIGYFLFGTLIVASVVTLRSAFPSAVAVGQDTPAAILAIAAASATATIPADSPAALATVVALMALSTLAAAVAFGLLGAFRLANMVRYVPYPVTGGFLAGTGWLLFDGGIGVTTGSGLDLAGMSSMIRPDVAARWLPALLLAGFALWVIRRGAGPLTLPGLLLAAVIVFHAVLWVVGVPLEQAREDGWLLGPLPDQALWQPPTPATIQDVHWDVIAGNAGTIAILVGIALLSFLLNLTGMELAMRRDVDVNRELKLTAVANALSGLGGGPVGYHGLSLSALSHRMSPRGRLTGMVIVVLFVGAMVGGAGLLEFLPTLLPGTVLLFLGLDFMVEWLYDARLRMARNEHVIVIVIAIAMAVIGVLEGVAIGILLAMVLFIVEYSRGTPIRRTLTGRSYHSNVDRPPSERRLLREHGDDILVLELQRFIFFGTANRLLETVRAHLGDSDRVPRYLILDFHRVTGLDASAASSFAKIGQLAEAGDVTLLVSGLASDVRDQFESEGLVRVDAGWRVVTDLDHGLEWCETQLLARLDDTEEPDPSSEELADLIAHMTPHQLPAGATLITEGDRPEGLFYLQSGNLTAHIERNGEVLRLRKMRPGVFIGELSLYADSVASASVVADEASTVLFISAADLAQLELSEPSTAIAFHRHIARLTSERLLDATSQLSTQR